jgi:hypothetical protein
MSLLISSLENTEEELLQTCERHRERERERERDGEREREMTFLEGLKTFTSWVKEIVHLLISVVFYEFLLL